MTDDLDRLDRLAAEATPGDLYTDHYELYLFVRDPRKGDQPVFSKGPGEEDTPNWHARGYGAGLPQEANTRKMVAAWNALPHLVAEVRRLRARVEELEGRRAAPPEPEPELTRESMIPWIKWWRATTGGTIRDGRDEALRRLGISLAEWEARWRSDDE
jgi:hypothetical protein